MKASEEFKDQYDELKTSIIDEIWQLILDSGEEDENILKMDMSKLKEPIVMNSWDDDKVCETIDEIIINDSEVVAISNCMDYNIEEKETNFEKFNIPFLIEILIAVEDIIKHK